MIGGPSSKYNVDDTSFSARGWWEHSRIQALQGFGGRRKHGTSKEPVVWIRVGEQEGGDKKTGPHTRTGGGKRKKIRAQLLKSSLTFPLICGTESKEKKRSCVALLGHRQLDSFHPGPTQTLGPRAVLGERFSFSGTSRLCRLTHSDLCPIC